MIGETERIVILNRMLAFRRVCFIVRYLYPSEIQRPMILAVPEDELEMAIDNIRVVLEYLEAARVERDSFVKERASS